MSSTLLILFLCSTAVTVLSSLNSDFELTNSITCSSVASTPALNLIGQIIGTGNSICQIVKGSPSSVCSYYVRYSLNGGLNWLGLTFQGTIGGTGCASISSTDPTVAKNWLVTAYINQGYCCSAPNPTIIPTKSPTFKPSLAPTKLPISCGSVASTPALNLIGPIIGTGNNICQIVPGSPTSSCSYYVKYSSNGGLSWLGLTFQGTPGGTGCAAIGPSDPAVAKNWLVTAYINQGYCCGAP